jgi:trigger factor
MESLDVKIEDLGKLKRKITVTVPQEKVSETYHKTYLSLKDKININGFRKGKIPKSLLEKRFKKAMTSEAIETLVPEYYEKAINQESLKPAIRPSFGDLDIDKKKPLIFSASFEIYPDFEFPELTVYELEKIEPEITDEDIQEQRRRHLDNAATFSPKEGKAEKGDQVVMDFKGKVDDESIADGKDQEYVLGSNQFLPEFETALEGMAKDEEKDFELTFPADYNEEKLQGKTAQFSVKVNEVKLKTPPEMNDKFFTRYGDQVKSEEEFNKYVEDEVKFQKETALKIEARNKIRDKLKELLEFDVPEQLLNEEKSVRLSQAKQKEENKDKPAEELEANAEKEATEELRFSIFVQRMLDEEDIKTDENTVYQRFAMNCAMMGIKPEDLIKEEYGKQIYQQIYGMVTEETVLDYIIEKATK